MSKPVVVSITYTKIAANQILQNGILKIYNIGQWNAGCVPTIVEHVILCGFILFHYYSFTWLTEFELSNLLYKYQTPIYLK